MRQGLEFIDTDQHVGPNMETLHKYAGPRLLERWDELVPYFTPVTEGHHLSIDPIPFKRDLNTGTDESQTKATGAGATIPLRKAVKMNFEVKPAPEVNNENWKGRLEDMDREGVDIALIFPATFSTASTVLDVEMQNELYGAYHRYLDDYCGEHPDRLKAAALMNPRDPEWSAAELRRYADRGWLAAVEVLLPELMPIDDPSLVPIFEAMDEADVPFVHHSFFYEPPYFPGYRDMWGNVVVARAAAHPWGAQRLLGYLLLSGVFADAEGGGSIAELKDQVHFLSQERERLLADLDAERNRVRRLKAANEEVSGRLEAVMVTLKDLMPAVPG